MKRKILVVTFAVILLLVSGASALSPYDADGMFIQDFLDSGISWKRATDNTGGFVIITETAKLNGSKCEFEIIGYPDRAYQVTLTVPFSKLGLDRNGFFTDVLSAYSAYYYVVMEMIPGNRVPSDIFDPFDIQAVLKQGHPYGSDYYRLQDGWEWIKMEPKYLWVQRRASGSSFNLSAHVLDTGDVWFNFETH